MIVDCLHRNAMKGSTMSDMTPDQIEFQIRRAFAAIYPDMPIKYQAIDESLIVSVSYGLYNVVFQYDIASDDDGYFYFGLVQHDGTISDMAVVRIPYPEEVR